MKLLITKLALFILFTPSLHAQVFNPWSQVEEGNLKAKSLPRPIVPKKYKTYRLNVSQMKANLKKAPLWHTEKSLSDELVMELPMPNGQFQQFQVVEAPVMQPDLAEKYPQIRSYAGYGLDDPTAYLRFDLTEQGFHAMVLTSQTSTVFIDPYAVGDLENYVVYYKTDYYSDEPFECSTDELNENIGKIPTGGSIAKAGDCKLRTYTLALACTGEYATYHGGTKSLALSAMNTTMTRVNGIFEKEASIHIDLHFKTDTLIFLNASTDPFTNTDGFAMLAQNQTLCDARIGAANYDFGHVFSTGGGGVAYVGIICFDEYKAGGVTGRSAPVGDAFNVDFVAHEMSHQFGAGHTQNNNCSSNAGSSMEPGSGSTIMGYAGVCAPNIQNNSDDYFHAISLQEIANYVTSTYGNVCATATTVNNAPTAAGGPDYVIPRSTPFVLTGTGTDPNTGDVLTYNWEQIDPQSATMPPVSTSTTGPLFRSFRPTTSPSRYFPRLQDLVNNVSPTWEVLPSVARTLNFRLTVRDNRPGAGCTKEDDVKVTVSSAGPFVVTAPNTAVSWPALSQQTVTWNVASTNATPVSCANVDIFLSTDGGLTYPIALLLATPNDGTQAVTLPDVTTNQARIMVKGAGNIFFDISDVNFTISGPAPDFSLDASPNPATVCLTTSTPVTVSVGKISTFSGNVTLSVSGLPSGVTASFSSTSVAVPGTSQLTLTASSTAKAGTYNITLTGVGSTGTKTRVIALTITTLATQAVLSSPAAGATAVALNPTLSWTAISGVTGYELQIANNTNFTNPLVNVTGITTASYTVPNALPENTLLYWRVRAWKACGPGAYSTSRSFTTTKIFPPIKFENGTLTNVTNNWQTVTLNNSYTSMVVVASVVVTSGTSPSVVTRIQNATGNSFQIKIQIAGNATGAAGPYTVYYMVAEEGVYTLANNGIKFEARKFTSTKTSRFSASTATWVYEARTFGNTYSKPVIVGQVMSYNDPNWSVFWASANNGMANPPTATSFSAGKHIAQDNVNLTRADETIGYLVFETGAGMLNGKRYAAALGSDIVKGITDSATGFSYTLSGFGAVHAAVVSSAAQDATEGSWAVLATSTPLTTTAIKTWALEDQITDTERTHTTDQVAYIVIGSATALKPGDDNPGTGKSISGTADEFNPEQSILWAYPNPVSNELNVEYKLPEASGKTLLTIHDLLGKTVLMKELDQQGDGHQQVILELGQLSPGYYFLQVSNGKYRQNLKFIRSVD